MKKTLILLTALACFGCKKDASVNYAILSGSIVGQNAGQISLSSSERIFDQIISVGEDGSFNDSIELGLGYYVLNDGINTTYLCLGSGDNIHITYNKKDYKNTLNIKGIGSEKTKYLSVKEKTLNHLINYDLKSILKLDESDFKIKFDHIKSVLKDTLSSFEGLSDKFKELEERNINYEILSRYKIYESSHARIIKDTSFKVSDSFLAELNLINYNLVEDFEFSSKYQYLVKSYYREIAKEISRKDSISKYLAWIKAIETIPSEVIRDKLIYDNAINEITFVNDINDFYNQHIKATSNEKVRSRIKKVYDKLNSLNPGNISPSFTNYENYNGSTTSFEDLKGKYIYIDVWATWCAPCIAEIPYLKKIEKKYKNKNIVFVGISIDKINNREKWKKMIDQKELNGIQLISDNDWNSDFIKEYLINGIPRYILIDPEGKIISSDAPRPSDPNLEELLDTLKLK
ncbi:MAG: TlpA family protein disulfide reductase [Cytophagales bacterium]|nr:TlpA family protein disulfide reductase [Cytophagales bacterium]